MKLCNVKESVALVFVELKKLFEEITQPGENVVGKYCQKHIIV